jgi:deazaflavin-dependent oxidoreductase (nitroreductase family)
LKIAGTVHRVLYSWSGGLIGRRLRGRPVLLLTTTGRKTGRLRTWPLCYVVVDRDLVLVAAAGGDPRHPAWYLNLRAEPRVHIRQGNRLQTMLARTVEGSERARLWQHVVHQFPMCVGYQRTTRREIPVVLLRPAAL